MSLLQLFWWKWKFVILSYWQRPILCPGGHCWDCYSGTLSCGQVSAAHWNSGTRRVHLRRFHLRVFRSSNKVRIGHWDNGNRDNNDHQNKMPQTENLQFRRMYHGNDVVGAMKDTHGAKKFKSSNIQNNREITIYAIPVLLYLFYRGTDPFYPHSIGLLRWYWGNYTIVPLHTSHNAPFPCNTMHHFVTGMCTRVHISVTKWCIVGYLFYAFWDVSMSTEKAKQNHVEKSAA